MNPIIWLLVGSVFLFIGSSRQAWYELQEWRRQLESTLTLAFELVEVDQKEEITRELESLSGPRRLAKKKQLNRLASEELERRGLELLSPQERELLGVSVRGVTSWSFIVVGSAVLAIDPIIELLFR